MKSFFLWVGRTASEFGRFVTRVAVACARLVARAAVAAWRSRALRFAGRTALSGLRVAVWTALLAGLAFAVGWAGYRHVPPGTIGVVQHNFGGGGIVPLDLPVGLHVAPRVLDELHAIDARTQVVSFAWASEGGNAPMLEVRTKDGSVAQIGASVPFRVRSGEANALVRDGLKHAWPQRARATIEKVLLQEFGEFTFESLTSTDLRAAQVDAALPRLNEALRPLHLEAERILVTHVFFGLEFEKKLQQTQLLRQTALMLDATTELERQRFETKLVQDEIDASERRIRSELDDEIQKLDLEGRARIAAVYADAQEYDRVRRTSAKSRADELGLEGERLLVRSQQEKDELANEIYDSQGGRMLLATRAAENLNLRQVTLNSNDPRVPSVLDLDEFVRLLVGKAKP